MTVWKEELDKQLGMQIGHQNQTIPTESSYSKLKKRKEMYDINSKSYI
jgi:hypothetical protein